MHLHCLIATQFIIPVGTIISSGTIVYSYLWNLYVVHLAIKLFFPVKSSKLFNSDHSRKIFIAEVVIVFIVGSVPSISIATVGPNYQIATNPPLFCKSYGILPLLVTVFPNLIVSFINHALILLILYKLHIVSLMVYVYSYLCNVWRLLHTYVPMYVVTWLYSYCATGYSSYHSNCDNKL